MLFFLDTVLYFGMFLIFRFSMPFQGFFPLRKPRCHDALVGFTVGLTHLPLGQKRLDETAGDKERAQESWQRHRLFRHCTENFGDMTF